MAKKSDGRRWDSGQTHQGYICESRGSNIKYCTVSRHLPSITLPSSLQICHFLYPHRLLALSPPLSFSSFCFLPSVSPSYWLRISSRYHSTKHTMHTPQQTHCICSFIHFPFAVTSPVTSHCNREIQRDRLRMPSNWANIFLPSMFVSNSQCTDGTDVSWSCKNWHSVSDSDADWFQNLAQTQVVSFIFLILSPFVSVSSWSGVIQHTALEKCGSFFCQSKLKPFSASDTSVQAS